MSLTVSSKKDRQKLIDKLSKTTHFKQKFEVECLLKVYNEVAHKGANKKLDRTVFREFLHNTFEMTEDIMMDRIFRAFDKDNDSKINEEEWVRGMSVFLRGHLSEKAKFCFEVYDMNSDGYISRDEMFHLLKNSFVSKSVAEEDPDEGIKDLVEICLKKLDDDLDHRVSFNDYKVSVEANQLLLEVLGPCLPDQKKSEAFEEEVGLIDKNNPNAKKNNRKK